MPKLYNRVKLLVATSGTVPVSVAGAAVEGYQTFVQAGVADGETVRYVLEDSDGSWEIGTGVYNAAAETLSRTVTESSNGNAAIDLSGEATLYIAVAAEDLVLSDDPRLTDTRNPKAHGHSITDVSGLQAALDGKLPLGGKATDASKFEGRSLSAFPYGEGLYGAVNTFPTDGGIGADAIRRTMFFRDNNAEFGSLGLHIQHANNGSYGLQIASEGYGPSNPLKFRYLTNGVWGTEYRIWSSAYQGAGSGMDADKLDGLHASSFATAAQGSNADVAYGWGDHAAAGYAALSGAAFTGSVSIDDNTASPLALARAASGTQVGMSFTPVATTYYLGAVDGGDLRFGTNPNHSQNGLIWHGNNDGAGSGLDADLLDGQHASAFATAAQGSNADAAYSWGDHGTVGYLTSVSWGQVTGKPATFTPSAHTHPWSEVTGKPNFATVATSGSYNDLSGKPTLGTAADKNVGTGANNVVQLDGTGKLPAVDGSALTNLPSAGLSSATLSHSSGAITLDLAAADWFEFEADNYSDSGPTHVAGANTGFNGESLTLPNGPIQDGDWGFLFTNNWNSTISGWTYEDYTQSSGRTRGDYYTKVLSASDNGATINFSGANNNMAASLMVLRNVDTANPFEATADVFDSSTWVYAASITTLSSNAGRLFACVNEYQYAGYIVESPPGSGPDIWGNKQQGRHNYVQARESVLLWGGVQLEPATIAQQGFTRSGSASADGLHFAIKGDPGGATDYTITFTNLPTLIKPKILDIEIKAGQSGSLNFAGATVNWQGFQPTFKAVGTYRIRMWAGNGVVEMEMISGPEDPHAPARFGNNMIFGG